MTKRTNTANLPEAPTELLAAIDKAKTLADKIQRFEQRLTALPNEARVAQAEAEAANQLLTQKEAQLLTADDADVPALQAEIDGLESNANAKGNAATRFQRLFPELDLAGETLYGDYRVAQTELLTERIIHTRAVQEILSDRIVSAAAELAEHSAVYRSFVSAADVSRDWQSLAHVSDPRHACKIRVSGGDPYDTSPNLLELPSDASNAAVAAAQPALDPLRKVTGLIKERRFVPLANRPKPSPAVRGYSRGPNGIPQP